MTHWFAEYAWLPDGIARDVRFEVTTGRFAAVTENTTADGAALLPGLALPGFANCHSHAFHRALRGRTHADGGTFWTWRERMYALAGRLDPDRYLALASATYAEMALAGITSVAEFHYLHHAPGGRPYAEPNAMGDALRTAAASAGIRLTLLDAAYLAGGLDADGHRPLDETQQRFSDGDVDAWAARVQLLADDANTRVGVAIHSVRAVPRQALGAVRAVADERPLHVHVSEQLAENDACLAFYGATPTSLLHDAGVLAPTTTAVHATHVSRDDVGQLAASGATVCLCPTTERDLGDGIGPARALADAGVPISLGSDQHAVLDLFEELRGVEMGERTQAQQRGRFRPAQLMAMLTAHAAIGWPDAGRLEVGARADLVAVRLDSPRTAGCLPEQAVYAATAADMDTVVVDGRTVVSGGRHIIGDVGRLLATAIGAAWRD
jgi:formiminoglutamate deiminase